MPIGPNHNATVGIPSTTGPHSVRQFTEVIPIFEERNYTISGVTKDSNGAALGNCTVKLFNKATDGVSQTAVSDASGNYSFIVDKTMQWYIVAYLAGGPDVAGTTVNTLAGS